MTLTSPVRVAVLGFGFMGRTHAACYAADPHAELVAVCSPSIHTSAAQSVAGNLDTHTELDLSGVELLTDPLTLLNRQDIDAVSICLPTPQHVGLAARFLNAGKHVFCEKPMARTLAECDTMIAAWQNTGRILMLGHVLRFWPHYTKAHELIASGELGEVLSARFERQSPFPRWSRWMNDPLQSGGAPLDLHLHDADVALWWFGESSDVRASGVVRGGLPLRVEANWTYGSGPLVSLLGSWDTNDAPYRMAFEVVGERGTLRFDSGRDSALYLFRADEATIVPLSGEDAYALELRAFIEGVQNKQAPPHGTPEQARRAIRIVLDEMAQMGAA